MMVIEIMMMLIKIYSKVLFLHQRFLNFVSIHETILDYTINMMMMRIMMILMMMMMINHQIFTPVWGRISESPGSRRTLEPLEGQRTAIIIIMNDHNDANNHEADIIMIRS